MDGDAFACVGGAQRSVVRRIDDRIENAAALQLRDHFELAVRCALPVEIERACERAHGSRGRRRERAPGPRHETVGGERQIRIVPALVAPVVQYAKGSGFAWIVREIPRSVVMQEDLGAGRIHGAQSCLLEPVAIIDIEEREGESPLVERAELEEKTPRRQHACRRQRGVVVHDLRRRKMVEVARRQLRQCRLEDAVVVTVQHVRMPGPTVGMAQSRAHGANPRKLRVAHHPRQPGAIARLGVAAEEEQIVGVDDARGLVMEAREREARAGIADTQHAMREPGKILPHLGVAVAVDDDGLEIAIRRLRERIEAPFQNGGIVPCRNQNRHTRPVVREIVPVKAQLAVDRPRGAHGTPTASATCERFVDRTCAGVETAGLRFARGGGRSRRGAPVVEHERDVDDPARVLACPEREVVVLRPFEAGPESAQRVEQRAAHDESVRKVHVAEQSLRRSLRLELRRIAATVDIDLVVVGIENVGVGGGGERQRDLADRIGSELVVLVEK